MSQYLSLGEKILNEGTWIKNERTGVRCLTLIGASQEYDVGAGEFPIPSARFTPFFGPIGELLGYWRGYTSAEQFRGVETKTWDMNAKNWNKGSDDYMGVVYGGVAKGWPVMVMDEPGDIRCDADCKLDLFHKVYNNISKGIDDRGETITFWNPGMFECGCLRPCLRTHTFSLLNDDLYLTSEQRSYDWALGGAYNSQQCYHMLDWMAAITGKNPKIAKHQIINAHIYENQIPFAEELVRRGEHPDSQPRIIRPSNLSLSALEKYAKPRDWKLEGYVPFEKMSIPFTV